MHDTQKSFFQKEVFSQKPEKYFPLILILRGKLVLPMCFRFSGLKLCSGREPPGVLMLFIFVIHILSSLDFATFFFEAM